MTAASTRARCLLSDEDYQPPFLPTDSAEDPNIAHQAILAGHSALFTTAADLLLDLNGQETARALERRLRHYTRPALLVID